MEGVMVALMLGNLLLGACILLIIKKQKNETEIWLQTELKELHKSANKELDETLKRFRVEMQVFMETAGKDSKTQLEQTTGVIQEAVDVRIGTLARNFTALVEGQKEEVTGALRSGLEAYFMQEEEEIQDWLKIAEDQPDEDAVQLLESAINKFPGSLEIMFAYEDRIFPFLKSADTDTEKRAVERYSRAARIFLDNCQPKDWEEARAIMTHVENIKSEYIQDKIAFFEVNAKQSIQELEELTGDYPLSDDQLERVEALDRQLPKNLLTQFPDLQRRYKNATQKLIRHFAEQPDEATIRRYNLQAVKSFKKALDIFTTNEKQFKQTGDLRLLSDLLGAWDPVYLSSATQTYFQQVYSEIFGKLEASQKPLFTELMLNTDKQKVTVR